MVEVLTRAGSPRSEGRPSRKDRARSKSPFRSFRWKKSPKSPRPGPASDDEDNLTRASQERASPSAEESHIEGTLVRKHVWESLKKASNRSWHEIFVICRGNMLLAYKDSKAAKVTPESYYKGESPIDLRGASVDIATDYTKKKNVFRIKLGNGSEYLLQAKDEDELKAWVEKLAEVAAGGGSQSRSQTLPASQQAVEPAKRRSFFTLKRT